MTSPQMPSEDHKRFDAICSRVGEWEQLPAVLGTPASLETLVEPEAPADSEEQHELLQEERAVRMNELILAGLLAPY